MKVSRICSHKPTTLVLREQWLLNSSQHQTTQTTVKNRLRCSHPTFFKSLIQSGWGPLGHLHLEQVPRCSGCYSWEAEDHTSRISLLLLDLVGFFHVALLVGYFSAFSSCLDCCVWGGLSVFCWSVVPFYCEDFTQWVVLAKHSLT